ncbi:hypothetical protein B0H14DRAFT_774740 [Mycena olivaceomarginata]|nr:hypothetical protein B0H14DRAFT_774740 [Mycena olivaceomarginata]
MSLRASDGWATLARWLPQNNRPTPQRLFLIRLCGPHKIDSLVAILSHFGSEQSLDSDNDLRCGIYVPSHLGRLRDAARQRTIGRRPRRSLRSTTNVKRGFPYGSIVSLGVFPGRSSLDLNSATSSPVPATAPACRSFIDIADDWGVDELWALSDDVPCRPSTAVRWLRWTITPSYPDSWCLRLIAGVDSPHFRRLTALPIRDIFRPEPHLTAYTLRWRIVTMPAGSHEHNSRPPTPKLAWPLQSCYLSRQSCTVLRSCGRGPNREARRCRRACGSIASRRSPRHARVPSPRVPRRPGGRQPASARRSACTTAIVAFPRMRTFDTQGKSLRGTTERRRTRALQDLRQTATVLAPSAQRSSSIAIATSPRMGPSSDLRTRDWSLGGYSCAAELPRSPLSPPRQHRDCPSPICGHSTARGNEGCARDSSQRCETTTASCATVSQSQTQVPCARRAVPGCGAYQAETGMIISGSAAIQVLENEFWDESDLDL